MFHKPAAEMVIGSSAVSTSLGLLKGALIRRLDADTWEQVVGRARTEEGEYYAWSSVDLPDFKVVTVRKPRQLVSKDGAE